MSNANISGGTLEFLMGIVGIIDLMVLADSFTH